MLRRCLCAGLLVVLGGCAKKQWYLEDPVDDASIEDATPAGAGAKEDAASHEAGGTLCAQTLKQWLQPQVTILLDRSNNMNSAPGFSPSRLAAAQSMLTAAIGNYRQIDFYLGVFPPETTDQFCSGPNCCTGTCCAGQVASDPGYISSLLQCTQGCASSSSDSPSQQALARVRDNIQQQHGGQDYGAGVPDVYVLLITASEPICGTDAGTPCGVATKAANDLAGLGIPVVVFAMGYQGAKASTSCLLALSKTSTTIQVPNGPSTTTSMPAGTSRLYTSGSSQEAQDNLKNLLDAVQQDACSFQYYAAAPPAIVSIDGKPIDRNSPDGWSVDPNNTYLIRLYGSACKQYLDSSQQHTVQGSWYRYFAGEAGPSRCP